MRSRILPRALRVARRLPGAEAQAQRDPRLVVRGEGDATGSFDLRLYGVANDDERERAVGGPPVILDLGGGQLANVTFKSAAARIVLRITEHRARRGLRQRRRSRRSDGARRDGLRRFEGHTRVPRDAPTGGFLHGLRARKRPLERPPDGHAPAPLKRRALRICRSGRCGRRSGSSCRASARSSRAGGCPSCAR